jgi:glycosyltransferase involved in cell wall biosynthesis
MKILIVTEDLPVPILGGAGKHAVLLANTLIEAGHHVEMLGRQRESDTDSANGFHGKLHSGIKLQGTGWKEHALGAFVPMRRLHLARRVWQAIQKVGLDWDVIHYHGHFPAVGALVPTNINFVHTLHDQGSECITRIRFKDGELCTQTDPLACAQCATPQPNAFQKRITAWAVQHHRAMAIKAFGNHKAIFVSRFLADRFSTNVASNIKIHSNSVHNFIDAEQLRQCIRAVEIPQKNLPKIFMAGRIDAGKGFGPFLDTLPDAAFTNYEITVAGDGPELRSIRERHENRGVRFIGWQPIEAVLVQTAQADIYVQPSLCEEACSTTVLEALALQRPVFALSRGSIPELAQYQTYTNQLQLFDNIQSLALAVSKATFAAPASLVADAADVRARLPEILSIYESNLPTIGATNQCKT